MLARFAVDCRDQGVTIGRTLESRQQEAKGVLCIGTKDDASGRSVNQPKGLQFAIGPIGRCARTLHLAIDILIVKGARVTVKIRQHEALGRPSEAISRQSRRIGPQGDPQEREEHLPPRDDKGHVTRQNLNFSLREIKSAL